MLQFKVSNQVHAVSTAKGLISCIWLLIYSTVLAISTTCDQANSGKHVEHMLPPYAQLRKLFGHIMITS